MPDTNTPLPFDAYTGSKPYIFVSYAHKDSQSIFPIIQWLNNQGYRIWYDEGIDPGNEWPDEIAKALNESFFFLVFVSKSAVDSRNVRNEINFALNKEKPLLAVHIEETELPPGLSLRMGDIQAILKWRMNMEHFHRKIIKSLPIDLIDDSKQEISSAGKVVDSLGAKGVLKYKKEWSCILRDVINFPIYYVFSAGREILLMNFYGETWCYALHNKSGKMLYKIKNKFFSDSSSKEYSVNGILWDLDYLYLGGYFSHGPFDIDFIVKYWLREGDEMSHKEWREDTGTPEEYKNIQLTHISPIQQNTSKLEAESSRIKVNSNKNIIRILNIKSDEDFSYEGPSDDTVTAIAIHEETKVLIAYKSGLIILLGEVNTP